MTAFLMSFRRFPTTFRRFPKIFENCPEGQTHFPEHFPRISENFRRCPKTFEEDPNMFRWYTNEFKYNLRDKLDHRNHRYLHMWRYHIFTCEDIVSFLSICYHSLYHWLLYNNNYSLLRVRPVRETTTSHAKRLQMTDASWKKNPIFITPRYWLALVDFLLHGPR